MDTSVSIVILAAGLGTRMKSRRAKVLHHTGGRPLIEHVVRTCVRIVPPENVVAVVGHQAEEVEAAVAAYGIGFVRQTQQRGTGDAVVAAREVIEPRGGYVLVLCGDGPLIRESTLRQLIERELASGAAATLITTVMDDPTGYGRVITDEAGRIQTIVEQKAATPEQLAIQVTNTGVYCFRAAELWKYIDQIGTDNPAGEYYLTDMVGIFRRAGLPVDTSMVEDSGEVLGINTRVELARVDRIFRDRKVEELMLAGVTIEKPETVTIDSDVRIGRDTVVGPFCPNSGRHRDRRGLLGGRVQHRAGLPASATACRSASSPSSMSRRVDAGARVGPYARLRIGNHVEAGAAVGNFVELKKTHLGAGSKANHLAYLGDSVIGPGCNIGAGTITCNYDGQHKHQTTIGTGAFIGSNSTLVAPIEIGSGAYIGAGSVITRPVPDDALGLGRERQINKEDWAKKLRERGAK